MGGGSLADTHYREALNALLTSTFIPLGYKLTEKITLDSVPESSKYEGLVCSLNDKKYVYRKGHVTPDRPGAFLAVWQRPASAIINSNKPIPLSANELDYLLVKVDAHSGLNDSGEPLNNCKSGMFVFPISVLIKKGIVSSEATKGKTGFRVFPPWSQDRGVAGTQVFSESGKKTQRWQSSYFLAIGEDGLMDAEELKKILSLG